MARPAAAPPFITVRLDPAAERPLYRQLYDAVRAAILDGRLAPGSQLPATRALAVQLSLSRFTVMNAFAQLLAEGFIEGRAGAGSFVSQDLPAASKDTNGHDGEVQAAARPPRLSQRGQALAAALLPSPLEEGRPRAFRPGTPALDQFPAATWARIAGRLYRRPPQELLTYGASAGYQPLRAAIAAYLRAARAIVCDPEQVIIVAGTQQALDLVGRVLLDPGDAAWIEDPGYPGARAALQGAGAVLTPVPVDAEGLAVAQGEQLQPDARLAYVTPSYQYPLGVTMSLARRLALLEWAGTHGAWILEDDYDSEFRYVGHPLAALAGLDALGHVIYMGTFSKVLFPALRLGYLVVPAAVVDAFVRARALTGRHAPTLEQAVLADFMAEGHFAHHLRTMRLLYQERQAAVIAVMQAELGGRLEVSPSPAGMHLVGWLDPTVDDRTAAERAGQVGVEVRPLSIHALQTPQRPAFLLGYTAWTELEMRHGARHLNRALHTLSA